GRYGVARATRLAVGWVNGDVLLEVSAAVVGEEPRLRRGLILKPVQGRGRVHKRRTAIALDNHVRPQAEDVSAGATAVESIDDQTKVLHQLDVEIERPATASRIKVLVADRIKES